MDESNSLREVPVASETIYDGKILHVEKWTVTCPNGKEALREIVVHKGAAAVVPVSEPRSPRPGAVPASYLPKRTDISEAPPRRD